MHPTILELNNKIDDGLELGDEFLKKGNQLTYKEVCRDTLNKYGEHLMLAFWRDWYFASEIADLDKDRMKLKVVELAINAEEYKTAEIILKDVLHLLPPTTAAVINDITSRESSLPQQEIINAALLLKRVQDIQVFQMASTWINRL